MARIFISHSRRDNDAGAADIVAAASAIADAAAAGEITVDEAAALSVLVANVAKAVETVELLLSFAIWRNPVSLWLMIRLIAAYGYVRMGPGRGASTL